MNAIRTYLSFFLLGLYVIFSFGFVINTHYCGGKLVDIGIFQEAKKCCCDKGGNSSACCDEEKEVIFLADEQTQVQYNTISVFETVLPATNKQELSFQWLKEKEQIGFSEDIPPPNISKHILHQVFTLYA